MILSLCKQNHRQYKSKDIDWKMIAKNIRRRTFLPKYDTHKNDPVSNKNGKRF